MAKNNSLDLGHFLNDVSFHSVQLDILSPENNNGTLIEIRHKLQEMVDNGIIKPIKTTVYQIDEVESAFRYMASGKQTGKLIIKIRDEEQELNTKPTLLRLKANPRVYFHEKKSYVILESSPSHVQDLLNTSVSSSGSSNESTDEREMQINKNCETFKEMVTAFIRKEGDRTRPDKCSITYAKNAKKNCDCA